MSRTAKTVLWVAAASFALTAAVAALPEVNFAYRNERLNGAMRTAEALIGSLAAFLVLGHLRRRCQLDDLALFAALGLLAGGNFLFGAIPSMFGDADDAFSTWALLATRLSGAALLVFAAFAPPRPLRRALASGLTATTSVAAMLLVIAVAAALLAPGLPEGVQERLPETSGRPEFSVHALVLASQVLALLLYAAAAVGFTRAADQGGAELVRWLAVACVLAAAAWLNYVLYPSLFTDHVYVGDGFRLGFFALVLGGALREIRLYWEKLADLAALEERRKVARDLHDGVAQELASISRNLAWIEGDDPFVERARAASQRAIAESRRAIWTLRSPAAQRPFHDELGETLQVVAAREGVRLVLDLDRNVVLGGEERRTLTMVASEAVTNAGRHGMCSHVRVKLSGGRRVRLLVEDDGSGFDAGEPAPEAARSFGLASMQQRASKVGATFRVASRPGGGTRVELLL